MCSHVHTFRGISSPRARQLSFKDLSQIERMSKCVKINIGWARKTSLPTEIKFVIFSLYIYISFNERKIISLNLNLIYFFSCVLLKKNRWEETSGPPYRNQQFYKKKRLRLRENRVKSR